MITPQAFLEGLVNPDEILIKQSAFLPDNGLLYVAPLFHPSWDMFRRYTKAPKPQHKWLVVCSKEVTPVQACTAVQLWIIEEFIRTL